MTEQLPLDVMNEPPADPVLRPVIAAILQAARRISLQATIARGALVIGGKSLFRGLGNAREKSKLKRADEARLREDLRQAIDSGKREKLENFLLLWGDKLTKDTRDHVQNRINEILFDE